MIIRKMINEEIILDKDIVKRAARKKIRLYDDEIFVSVKMYKNTYISNYGRVIVNEQYPVLKTIYKDKSKSNNRYYYVRLGEDDKKEYIHTLVAYAFCEIPSNPFNEDLQVHHIKKFNPWKSNMINNRADNLMIVKKTQHGTIEGIKAIRTTHLPSIKMDFETGKLKQRPERKTFDNILEACDYLSMDLDNFIKLILKKKTDHIGEVAESHFYNSYLINIVRYKPKVNKKIKIIPGEVIHMTLDRW